MSYYYDEFINEFSLKINMNMQKIVSEKIRLSYIKSSDIVDEEELGKCEKNIVCAHNLVNIYAEGVEEAEKLSEETTIQMNINFF